MGNFSGSGLTVGEETFFKSPLNASFQRDKIVSVHNPVYTKLLDRLSPSVDEGPRKYRPCGIAKKIKFSGSWGHRKVPEPNIETRAPG